MTEPTLEVIDGHDLTEIIAAVEARNLEAEADLEAIAEREKTTQSETRGL